MTPKKTILPNGLRIITVPIKDAPTVTILVTVEAGSKYETKNVNGLSHFLEHMCFKGTTKRPNAIDISRELDSIGAHYNASTSQEFTGYYAKSHPKHISKLVDVISDMYLNPTFPAKEIEKEKGVIVQEILMYEDMPQRHVFDVFLELMYGDQPAGWNIAGTPELVKSFSQENFLAYRREHYVASGTIVVVAGNFEEAALLSEIEKAFAGISVAAKNAKFAVNEAPNGVPQTAPAIKFLEKKTDQTHLVIGVRTFGAGDKRAPALSVLNSVLGGGMSARLFQKLRDELGICYYVRSGTDEYTDHGSLIISAGVDSDRIGEATKAIIGEMKCMKDEIVSPEELAKAKEQIIGGLYLGLESSDAIADFVSFQEVLRGKILTPEEYSEKIAAVSAEDVRTLAHEIFTPERLNIALISKEADTAALSEILATL
ncbi:MAG: pitrilysin family protein [Patescibacteria group bacterium]